MKSSRKSRLKPLRSILKILVSRVWGQQPEWIELSTLDRPQFNIKTMVIKLSKDDKAYIAEVFGYYAEQPTVGMSMEFKNGVIAHLYANRSTGMEGDRGYIDALLFTLKLYDYETKICYVSHANHDNISSLAGLRMQVRLFKDGSTMVIVKQPCKVELYQSAEISPL